MYFLFCVWYIIIYKGWFCQVRYGFRRIFAAAAGFGRHFRPLCAKKIRVLANADFESYADSRLLFLLLAEDFANPVAVFLFADYILLELLKCILFGIYIVYHRRNRALKQILERHHGFLFVTAG